MSKENRTEGLQKVEFKEVTAKDPWTTAPLSGERFFVLTSSGRRAVDPFSQCFLLNLGTGGSRKHSWHGVDSTYSTGFTVLHKAKALDESTSILLKI